jgi:hypothetical protein
VFEVYREPLPEAQIGVNLYSEVVNPSVGKQVFMLTDVNLAEPDPKLFELPEGFDAVDRRKPVAQHPE